MLDDDEEDIKRAPAWTTVVSFLAYFGFFIFLLAKYGRTDDPSWIRGLNQLIIICFAVLLFSLNFIDNYLQKRNKHIAWFDFIHRMFSGCMLGVFMTQLLLGIILMGL